MRTIATVGVYQSSLEDFLDTLRRHRVEIVLDVRQRRGVRGRGYTWANSLRLQTALEQAGIQYRHVRELAPTTELRQLQYREDDRLRVGKRSRVELAEAYRRRYLSEVLDQVDLGAVLQSLPGGVSALLCVERDARACHRSLIADRLQARYGVTVVQGGAGNDGRYRSDTPDGPGDGDDVSKAEHPGREEQQHAPDQREQLNAVLPPSDERTSAEEDEQRAAGPGR